LQFVLSVKLFSVSKIQGKDYKFFYALGSVL
jgi:hypothetical protein